MSWSLRAGDVQDASYSARSRTPAQPAAGYPASFSWRSRILCGMLLAAALAGSRIPLAPRHLITFDEINFALSIEQFNPAAHQPQPPGYPLFVGLLKLLSLGIPKVETVFLAAALLLSMAALLLLWTLGEQMLPGCGFIAALVLLFDPPFWYSALTNPVRLGLAAGAVGVALCLFAALRHHSSRWFVAASAALGLAAGFRPTLLIDMAPLVLWVALSIRLTKTAVTGAMAAFCLAVAAWLHFLAASTGGFGALYHVLVGYLYDQTRDTSFVMGARAGAAIHMALEAFVWSCLGVLTWIWALPSAVRRDPSILQGTQTNRFLMLWFLPAFAFSAIVHVGDPDQTLAFVPVTCLIGAHLLASFPLRRRAALLSAVLLLNIFLFFKPISKIAKASTYVAVRGVEAYVAGLAAGTGAVQNAEAVTVVFPPDVWGWRNISYYLPAMRLLVASDPSRGAVTVFHIQGRHADIETVAPDAIPIPPCGVIALVDPSAPYWDGHAAPAGLSRNRNLWRFPSAPGISFRSRGVRFVVNDSKCALP